MKSIFKCIKLFGIALKARPYANYAQSQCLGDEGKGIASLSPDWEIKAEPNSKKKKTLSRVILTHRYNLSFKITLPQNYIS